MGERQKYGVSTISKLLVEIYFSFIELFCKRELSCSKAYQIVATLQRVGMANRLEIVKNVKVENARGLPTICRLDKTTGLVCERTLQKIGRFFKKDLRIYGPTNRLTRVHDRLHG